MSAWRIGTESVEPASREGVDAGGPGGAGDGPGGGNTAVQDALNKLTKWIPGDAIAFYVAAVSLFTVATNDRPSVLLLIIGVLFAAALVVGGAYSQGPVTSKTWKATLIGAVAFALWAVTVPAGGWLRWDLVADHIAGATLVAGAIALLVSQFADGWTRDG